jgi:REP element-mobilizing transposase RayT
MWNNTDIPLAYLITFRSHGTWLHGDKRGSVDRFHNRYQSPYLAPSCKRLELDLYLLSGEPTVLNATQRESVELAIHEVCQVRDWNLRAINVRTNHVHTVVSIGSAKPERALNAFKAYATRKMRENNCWDSDRSPWADKGSKKRLWNEHSVQKAVEYVVHGQGEDLPEFD